MAAVVLGQHVVAEIIGRVPPHRVDVIAVALGVVVLDEQPWSLDAEIMPLSGFGAARPGKDEVVHRSEEHTSELQSPCNIVCRLLLEKNTVFLLKWMFNSMTRRGLILLMHHPGL